STPEVATVIRESVMDGFGETFKKICGIFLPVTVKILPWPPLVYTRSTTTPIMYQLFTYKF
ncbi:MAG: hypothetical protein MHPSP_003178, partial [Paramarteilia canceri]